MYHLHKIIMNGLWYSQLIWDWVLLISDSTEIRNYLSYKMIESSNEIVHSAKVSSIPPGSVLSLLFSDTFVYWHRKINFTLDLYPLNFIGHQKWNWNWYSWEWMNILMWIDSTSRLFFHYYLQHWDGLSIRY